MANLLTWLPATIGAVLAIATIPLHLLVSKTQSEQFAALLLAAIGAIYVEFGQQTGSRAQIVMELTVARGFLSAAVAGLWVTPWIVPAAYSILGILDYAHHNGARLAPHTFMVSAILRGLRLGGGSGFGACLELARLNNDASHATRSK
jgi:hypothetical protein